MSQLNLGIIGCGRMGRERARCITALGSKVSLVFDTDAGRAGAMCDEYQTSSADSFQQFFTSHLDAVMVCIPPGSRGSFELECLSHGLPLLSEKPAGLSASTVSLLADHSLQTGTINAVGYMNRYRSSIQAARRKLENAKAIGFSGYWVCRPYEVPWWKVKELSGGPHNEQATHLFDLTRFLFGQLSDIQSRAIEPARVSSTLAFNSGLVGNLFYSCEGSAKDIGLRIFTEKGTMVLSGWDFSLTENTIDGYLENSSGEDIFLKETAIFLDAVYRKQQQQILSNFADAQFTQAAMDAAGESIESGERVEVNEHARDTTHSR